MPRTKTSDLLMWVGAVHYSTVESFVREAAKVGVSKRVANVPVGVKLGKSLLFLAHDEAVRVNCRTCRGVGSASKRLSIELVKRQGRVWVPVVKATGGKPSGIRKTVVRASLFRELRDKTYRESDRKHRWRVTPGHKLCPDCAGRGEVPDGRVFGFCVIDRLELIFDCASAAKEYEERQVHVARKPKVPVTYVPGVDGEPERGCGYRAVGGYYLVSEGDDACSDAVEMAGKLGEGFTARGPVVMLPEPVKCRWGRFRAAKVIDKDVVLKPALRASKKAEAAKTRKRSKKKRAK